ncbi:MAG TPA: COX15/CtaA family protein [Acidobacteriaceae bacterium]|jgi:cytochrome c oxidase assembly protein subunit 15|nr:COX15/CtaA family protein [Acidobacteriaceae bacterium]
MQQEVSNPAAAKWGLARFAWGVLAYFLLVVLWGAVVRATNSGGGCGAHWPLCNGYLNPLHHPRLATIIEFAHRQSTTVATCLTLALAFWTFRATAKGHRARKAALWSVFFLVTEALLGAALVLRGWVEQNDSAGRVVAQAIHFTNTLLLMAALTLTASFLGGGRETAISSRTSKLAAWFGVIATIVMGATGALAALADTLFPSPSVAAGLVEDFASHAPMLVRMRWLHPASAVIGTCCVLWAVSQRVKARGQWDNLSFAVIGLLALQFLLGIADVLLLAPAWMQLLHLLGADLYWVALILLAAEIIWPDAEKVNTDARGHTVREGTAETVASR